MKFRYMGDGCAFLHNSYICDVSLNINNDDEGRVSVTLTDATGVTLQKNYRDMTEVFEEWVLDKIYNAAWDRGYKSGQADAERAAKREKANS